MADIDSEQLREAIQELNDTLNGLGTSATTGRGKFIEAADALFKVKGSGAAAANALDQMGQSLGKLTGQIYRGEQGTKKYADAVDDIATAIGALLLLLPQIKLIGKVITLATLGLVKFGKASAEMGDKLFKGYQDISRSGAAASDGLQGVFQLMQDFRLSLDDLPQLSAIIRENAQALALFRGSVFEGAKSMGAIRREITVSGLEEEFMALGMNTQEINEALGGFVNVFGNLGMLQNKTTKEATASLRGYIYEVDLITKLTGATRKEQEAAAMQAMAIEQFNAKIAELRQRELQGDKAAGKEAQDLLLTFQMLNATSPKLAAQFAAMTTGFIGPGSIGAALATNAEALQAANSANMDYTERVRRITTAVAQFMDPNSGLGQTMARFGKLAEITGLSVEELRRTSIFTEDFGKKLAAAKTEQERMALVNDELLKNGIATAKSDLNSMQSMQKFVELGVNPATSALKALAGAAEYLTSFLPTGTGAATKASDAARAAAKAQGKSYAGQLWAGAKAEMRAMMPEALGGGITAGSEDLSRQGLKIKPGDVQKEGGLIYPATINLARKIQESVAGFSHFSAFNDQWHNENAPSSQHTQGKAFDFSLNYIPTKAQGEQIAAMIQSLGAVKVQDEYNNPSSKSTAGHFHVQALQMGGPAFRGRSYLVGERGPELFTPSASGAVTSNDQLQRAMGAGLDEQISLTRNQISQMEELLGLMRNQNNISSKILQYSTS